MGSKSGKEIAKDLDTLRQDVSALADHLSGFLSDKGDEVMGDAKQGVQRIRENAADVIAQTAGKSRALARSRSSRGSQALQQAGQDRAVSRLLGPKNVLPAVVLGAVILAAAQAVPRSKSKAGAAE